MCNTCQSAVPVCKCTLKDAVDWSKPVMFEDDPDTQIRVICTDVKTLNGCPVLLLKTFGHAEVITHRRFDGTGMGTDHPRVVNRPEYKYKNVYSGTGSTAEHSSLDEIIKIGAMPVPPNYRGNKAICVVRFIPGDNKSAKIVHTY